VLIDDFMAQTGDPLGTGEGASSLPDLRQEFMFRRGPEMPFIQAAEQSRARLGFYKALPIESQPDAQMAVTNDGRVSANALHCQGVVSMARSDNENSGNSQFFIMRQPNTALDKRYTIFRPCGLGPKRGDADCRRQPAAESRIAWWRCVLPPTCRKQNAPHFTSCAPMVRNSVI
jgi:cyclophilin family peptidyl-prolyl cis-trans isomerase